MDRAKGYVKDIVQKCWDNEIFPIISTLTPRKDITEDGKILFDYFNNWIKEYATEQSQNGKECAYIDFFNAGKDFDPPQPLEDPNNPYKLNPLYDGDNVYDENGNLIRSGLGVHLNPEGYRVMGYAVPLTLFRTASTGIKLYVDSACTRLEKYNDTEASNPYYSLTIPNVRLGVEKTIIRYIKNTGSTQTLYYIYINNESNMDYYFIDDDGNEVKALMGILNGGLSKQIKFVIKSRYESYNADFNMHIIGRDLSIGES